MLISWIVGLLQSEEGRQVAKQCMFFFAAWFLFRKEFRKQFSSLTEAIKSLEKVHNERLMSLENDVLEIKKKIVNE